MKKHERLLKEGLKKNSEEIIKTILKFQIELINKKDIGCYTVEDAIRNIKNK